MNDARLLFLLCSSFLSTVSSSMDAITLTRGSCLWASWIIICESSWCETLPAQHDGSTTRRHTKKGKKKLVKATLLASFTSIRSRPWSLRPQTTSGTRQLQRSQESTCAPSPMSGLDPQDQGHFARTPQVFGRVASMGIRGTSYATDGIACSNTWNLAQWAKDCPARAN